VTAWPNATVMNASPARSAPPSRIARRRPSWLAGVAIGGALIAMVVRRADLERFAALAHEAQPAWLVAALGLQAMTYLALAAGWQLILRRAGAPVPLGRLIPLALAKLFADQVVPSAGMGGNVLLVDRLTAMGVPRGAAMATLLITMIGYYAVYASLALIMLLVLVGEGRATTLLIGLVAAFLLVAMAVPAIALWLRARGSRALPPALARMGAVRTLLVAIGEGPADLVGDRGLIGRVASCQAIVFLADALTFACCLAALGQPFAAGAAFVALIVASIVVTLGPIPLGLGSFEATATAMLHKFGIGIEAAITATLLLRGLTLWLPLVPGALLLRRAAGRGG
jgi:uncharacterized membrane protein YbhN (UPF0104 family)